MLVAIAGLVACLVFTVARLLYVETDLRSDDGQTSLWQITQAQFEATLAAESLARAAAGEPFSTREQEPAFRMAVLVSRLAALLEEPQAQLIDRIGMMGSLKQHYLQTSLAQPLLDGPARPRRAPCNCERRPGNSLTNCATSPTRCCCCRASMARKPGRPIFARSFESLAFILGIVVTASVLLLRLLKGMQEANQAKRLLRQEQELSGSGHQQHQQSGHRHFRRTAALPALEPGNGGSSRGAAGQHRGPEPRDARSALRPSGRGVRAGAGRRRRKLDPRIRGEGGRRPSRNASK